MTKILKELSEYANKMVDGGLVVGAGGNLSVRHDEFMYISPSGYDLRHITEDEWVKVEISTGKVLHDLKPSSEIKMHLECYRRCEKSHIILHAHPTYTVAVSSTGKEIPSMFPDFPAMIKKISYIDYVIPTTEVLANLVGDVIVDSQAVVMRNHGVLTTGITAQEAFFYMQLIEEAAKVFAIASSLDTPRILTKQECEDLQNLSSEVYRSDILKKM